MKKAPDPLSYAHPEDPLFRRLLIGTLERATGKRRISRVYEQVKALEGDAALNVWAEALRRLRIGARYDAARLAELPRAEPLVFIANHPFGVVDGLLLGKLIREVRPNFRILVNEVLCRDSLFRDYFLPVDFRESKAALRTNLQTRQIAQETLRSGGIVGIFPSGGVATARVPWREAVDLEWKRFTAALIQRSEATVVPLYFHGRNSTLFQFASRIDQQLRLGLLLNEVRNKMDTTVEISIGEPVPPAVWREFGDRQALLDRLREMVTQLGKR